MSVDLRDYEKFLDLLEKNLESDAIQHYGVLGMKWGVRKDNKPQGYGNPNYKGSKKPELKSFGPNSISRKTKSGETLTLSKQMPTRLHKALGKVSSSYRANYAKSANLTIKNSSGKTVGNASVYKKSADELNLVWIDIKSASRGKGYATAALKAAQDFGASEGMKKLTLEVPGNAPDARHIYEKLGFKVTKEAEGTDDIWGGLTEMEYVFKKAKHSGIEGFTMDNKPTLEDALAHYGVLGMKWGVRKDRKPQGYGNPNYKGPLRRRKTKTSTSPKTTKQKAQDTRRQERAKAARREVLKTTVKYAAVGAIASVAVVAAADHYILGGKNLGKALKFKDDVANKIAIDGAVKAEQILKKMSGSAGSASTRMTTSAKELNETISAYRKHLSAEGAKPNPIPKPNLKPKFDPKTPPKMPKSTSSNVDPGKRLVEEMTEMFKQDHADLTNTIRQTHNKMGMTYDPFSDPFVPAYERERLNKLRGIGR